MTRAQTVPEDAAELGYHGGNLNAARRRYPHAPQPWIDLSTGINGVPYPVAGIAPGAWTRLSEPSDVAALESAARSAYGAQPAAAIVAAPGTQALIQWLPRLFPARRVAVVGFTYQEHEICWRAAGADVAIVSELSDLAGFDAAVVVSPNNPDGRIFAPDALAAVAESLFRRGGRLIVDEAFMDVLGRGYSLVPHLPASGAVVLRSFGKAYGLAGLRLGFAVGSAGDCMRLRGAIGPWAVSGPAITIGRRALADAAWLSRTVMRLSQEATRLDRLLEAARFEVVGGTPLFRLVRHDASTLWFERLCQAGILTRPFPARPHWLRFGIPHGLEDWARLETALASERVAHPAGRAEVDQPLSPRGKN